ncbi:MAG: helix-turn-helix transcriptional regulator [Dehalococcoidia bacterium]|nr:helix-turn-helix transcriptional regulator [Dehalococcoidia bacterium]
MPGQEAELTRREQQVLALLARGYTLDTVAAELFDSTNTVKTHTLSIYRKLGVSSRSEAAERYWKELTRFG